MCDILAPSVHFVEVTAARFVLSGVAFCSSCFARCCCSGDAVGVVIVDGCSGVDPDGDASGVIIEFRSGDAPGVCLQSSGMVRASSSIISRKSNSIFLMFAPPLISV